jgi:hypothetical protein
VEALGFLIALDEQLAATAEQALRKKIDPDIRDLAVQASADLRTNVALTRALAADEKITLVDTTEITTSRAQSTIALENLGKVEDAKYGSEFLKALISAGDKAVDLIDKRMWDANDDDRILKHLQKSRGILAGSVARAKELQSLGK